MATVRTPRAPSDGRPRHRRVQQHGRHRRQALPHRRGEDRRPARSSASQPAGVRIGVVAFGPTAVIVQPPTTDHAEVLHAIDSPLAGRGHVAGRRHPHLARRHRRQDDQGQPGGARQRQLGPGRHRLLRRGDDRADLRRGGHEPDRSGDDGAAGVGRRRPRPDHRGRHRRRHDGADRRVHASPRPWTARRSKTVATVTNGSYHQVDDQAGLAAISKTINLHFTVVTRAHRDHGALRRCRPPCSSSPARCSRCCGSGGWCE